MRNLPRCLALDERLRIEAIVTACDIIELSFGKLMVCLEIVSDRPLPDVTERERIESAMLCWSIVDQFYALSKLTNVFSQKTSQWPNFKDFAARISKMRNVMDHLSNNLGNAGKRTGATHPLHGGLLFACGIDENGEAEFISFNLGALHQSHHSPVLDTLVSVAAKGVSNITFAAFDSEVSLSDLQRELSAFLIDSNGSLEAGTVGNIRHQAEQQGLDADLLLNDTVSGAMKGRIRLGIKSR